jgi:hypothetical protein
MDMHIISIALAKNKAEKRGKAKNNMHAWQLL